MAAPRRLYFFDVARWSYDRPRLAGVQGKGKGKEKKEQKRRVLGQATCRHYLPAVCRGDRKQLAAREKKEKGKGGKIQARGLGVLGCPNFPLPRRRGNVGSGIATSREGKRDAARPPLTVATISAAHI